MESFKISLNPSGVQVLTELDLLLEAHIQEKIRSAFYSQTDINDARAFVRGLEFARRLLEPVIRPSK